MKKLLIFVFALLLCLLATSALAAETTYSGVCDPIVVNTAGEHTIILNGVTINSTNGSAISIKSPASKLTIILKDGSTNTLKGQTISSNYVNGTGYAGINNNGVDLVIRCESAEHGHTCSDSCGKLTITGGNHAAGIGGDTDNNLEGNITIEGGNIIANGGGILSAGIGGGENGHMTGTVKITGGIVEANGTTSAAGIGGGSYGHLKGAVKITGGIVKANNYSYYGYYNAGIGGGFHGNLEGTVEITGGTVIAKAGEESSGIGGGYGLNGSTYLSGTVTISGGNVTAMGGSQGAGIGGNGDGGLSGNVIITGGNVTATGGTNGAGIGGGHSADLSGTVKITGGNVTATGSNELAMATGIGGGYFGSITSTGKVIIEGGTVNATGRWAGIGCGTRDYPHPESGQMNGSITISGGTVTAVAQYGPGVSGPVTLDPIVGAIVVKKGSNEDDALELEDSPYDSKTTLYSLGMSYVHFRPGTPHFCSGGTATCKNLAVCGGCGKTYGELAVNNHVHKIILPAVPATTVSTGLTEGLKCSDCQTIIIPQQIIPMLPSDLPQTGDDTNFAFLILLAAAGMIGMTIILRRKNEA